MHKMSAILFNQEQLLKQEPSEQIDNDFVEPSTYANSANTVAHCDDVCEELLGSKMAALELNEVAVLRHHHNCDGSDSGVEIATSVNVTLQRALSSNSGGYTSSNGGLDETTHGLNMSCDSSMISCSSDLYELKVCGDVVQAPRLANNYECCSENGSESSSVAGHSMMARKTNIVKQKVAIFEPNMRSEGTTASRCVKERDSITTASATTEQMHGVPQVRPRLSNLKRTASLPRPTKSPALQTRERAVEKPTPISGKSVTTAPTLRATQVRTPKAQKPDSLPNALCRTQSASMQRLVQRTPSLSRARTPGTPSDDGRWPGPGSSSNTRSTVATTSAKRGLSATHDLASIKSRSSMLGSMEAKQNISNPYSTLPRRRRQKSVEDLTGRNSRCGSITRESRMSSSVVLSSRKNLVSSFGGAVTPTQIKMLPSLMCSKNAPAQKVHQGKTRIYHETGVQTALTVGDIEKAFAGGIAATRPVDAADQRDQQTQADVRDREMERLRDEVRQLAQREHDLTGKLQRERDEKLALQRELHLNTERVVGMLEMARVAVGSRSVGEVGTPTSDDGSSHDSLLMLESQIQMSGHELIERQQEIGQLRHLCRSLQLEMQRSLTAQECLLQEKAAIELESSELQDFLQHEKAAMCDALKELESEYQACKQHLVSRDEEVKVLRDECRHLVRLNEQRRQENRMLQTKYAALESKSKELIMQQNSSVSGASVALSGLYTRLDSLVDQLVSSYSISEQDLEDIGFQTETQTNAVHASCDSTNECENQLLKTTTNGPDLALHHNHSYQLPQPSDGSLSPQRNQSFIAAVISAIRNATTPSGKKLLARNSKRAVNQSHNPSNNNNNHNQTEQTSNGDDSDSTEMLDSETEPCLMMDNVLEDVAMPDSHSHNMVSSCTGMISQMDVPSELVNVTTGDESLHNLSQAIANRQQVELHINAMSVQKVALQLTSHDKTISEDLSCHDSVAEMPSLVEYCMAQAVVDQVMEVDSLVTKLLKVLRLIQMDNDNCIQQLIVDKNKLQQNKEDMLEKLKDLQDENIKLQDELMDATQELMLKNSDLSSTKAEMQRHRKEIDRLTEDVCNLSTLCSNYRKLSPTTELAPTPHALLPPRVRVGAAAAATTTTTTTEDDNDINNDGDGDVDVNNDDNECDPVGILNLLRMWQAEGQLKDSRVHSFLSGLFAVHHRSNAHTHADYGEERLRIYANQLENVLRTLGACDNLEHEYPMLQELRRDIEIVKLNANWTHFVVDDMPMSRTGEDVNANEATTTTTNTTGDCALRAN